MYVYYIESYDSNLLSSWSHEVHESARPMADEYIWLTLGPNECIWLVPGTYIED